MKANEIFKQLDLMMLPHNDQTYVLDDEFILTDTLETSEEVDKALMEEGYIDFILSPHPFKISFTIAIFCKQGTLVVRVNLKEYHVKENTILVVLAGSIGECIEISSDCKLAIIAFSNNHNVVEVNSYASMVARTFLTNEPLIQIPCDEMDDLLSIFRLMKKKLQQPDFIYKREAISGYMQVFFSIGYHWMHSLMQNPEGKQIRNRQKELFDRFLREVQKHCTSERNISFYANILCVTPKYLSQVVYKTSGLHCGDWIRDFVILEAKALLKSRQYTVQQISEMLNFPNPSFFGKYFKAAVNQSPKSYQKM